MNNYKIPYNKPSTVGNELQYIEAAIASGKISGNGQFTKKCQAFFKEKYGFKKCLLTSSCTDALEMCAILLDIQAGDEVIVPAYTFVSSANAFLLRGAKIVFIDSQVEHPNMDVAALEQLITPKTKAIVVIHYAGMACDMDKIMAIADKHQLFVVEDAAHAIDAFYKDRALGSIGHLSAFSFHETKNVISGEGGMLVVNDEQFIRRAEIVWEKGTNRSAFFRGEINKYNWVDIGSSFLPSELTAAFLFAQLENIERIQAKRVQIWQYYFDHLKILETKGLCQIPHIPKGASINGHLFYLVCPNEQTRNALIDHLKAKNILAVFHYLALHQAPFFQNQYEGTALPNSEHLTHCLVRLPLFFELSKEEQNLVIEEVLLFFDQKFGV